MQSPQDGGGLRGTAHGAAPAGRQRLHFSGDALRQLKQEAEEGADTWVSTNEALLAHVYLLLLDAAGVQDRKQCGIAAAVDLRGKVGDVIPPRMLGRAVVNTDAIAGEELLVDLSDDVDLCFSSLDASPYHEHGPRRCPRGITLRLCPMALYVAYLLAMRPT